MCEQIYLNTHSVALTCAGQFLHLFTHFNTIYTFIKV